LAGLNILLTEYEKPFFDDMLLPSGNLREAKSSAGRADMILVTKCPEELDKGTRKFFSEKIKKYSRAPVFFTKLDYGKAYHWINRQKSTTDLGEYDYILLVCGIARPGYLIQHVKQQNRQLSVKAFNDHHVFSANEIKSIINQYASLPGEKKLLLTTEKDAVRLMPWKNRFEESKIDLFCIPVETAFLQEEAGFREIIKTFIQSFKNQ
jgi:tetraacyldisaccharide 4'-kinase